MGDPTTPRDAVARGTHTSGRGDLESNYGFDADERLDTNPVR
jgi:hypothetical protein